MTDIHDLLTNYVSLVKALRHLLAVQDVLMVVSSGDFESGSPIGDIIQDWRAACADARAALIAVGEDTTPWEET